MLKSAILTQSPDLLVIGLGRSGMAALEAARSAGASVIGVEQSSAPGLDGRLDCEYNSRAWGIFSDGTVAIASVDKSWRCTPRATVVATGAIDIPLPVPGWRLPGSIGAYHASRSLETGASIVVVRGPHARPGELAPDLNRFHIVREVNLADGIPLEILGANAVAAVRIGDTTIATTHVILDNGIQVENGLARMAGIPSIFSVVAGGDAIMPGTIFAVGGTLISVIGNAAGVDSNLGTLIREASETATLLSRSLAGGEIPSSIPSERTHPDASGAPLLPKQTTPDTLVCPSEGVTMQQVLNAIERGATTVNDVKRRTRAGMGACQGRDCHWTIRAMLAAHHRSFATPMTARPPIAGITLRELAGLGHS